MPADTVDAFGDPLGTVRNITSSDRRMLKSRGGIRVGSWSEVWVGPIVDISAKRPTVLPMSAPLQSTYDRLYACYGPQGWWPAESPFEVMVGAVLTQNTSWRNVEKAITSLREAGVLDPHALHAMPTEELAELIRSAGYFRVKARRLKNLVAVLVQEFHGDLEQMFSIGLPALRARLLDIHGIGPETADSIILYAAGYPTFVVDTYTARVLKRHGWIEPEATYGDIQDAFHASLPLDADLFNEFHALIVRVGKEYCKPSPQCERCPLNDLLPADGPLSWED